MNYPSYRIMNSNEYTTTQRYQIITVIRMKNFMIINRTGQPRLSNTKKKLKLEVAIYTRTTENWAIY